MCTRPLALLVLLLSTAPSCGSAGPVEPAPLPPDGQEPASLPDQAGAPAEAKGSLTVLAGREGLPDDSPILVAVRKLATCTLEGSMFDIQESCPEHGAWRTAMPSMRSKDDEHAAIDVSLIRLAHDADVNVRRAALFTMNRAAMQYKFDAELAAALLDAAEAERDPFAAGLHGDLCASISGALPGVLDREKKLATTHPVLALRVGLVGNMLFGNKMLARHVGDATLRQLFDFVASMTKDPDAEVRQSALSAFWVGTPDGLDAETCAVWKSAVSDSDPAVARKALDLLVRKPCAGEHEWALGLIERRVAQKQPDDGDSFLLQWFARNEATSPAVKQRAEKIRGQLGDR